MKRIVLGLFVSALIAPIAWATVQEKPKAEESDKKAESRKDAAPVRKEITPVRVQVVFSEYDGEKRVSSLPYTLLVNADDYTTAVLRMGLRVPVAKEGSGTAAENYFDVGTNVDGRAERMLDGRFNLHLGVERSSLYWPGSEKKAGPSAGLEAGPDHPNAPPVVQQFRSQLNLLLRDGQTIAATLATDPVTGRVLKVEVTLNTLK